MFPYFKTIVYILRKIKYNLSGKSRYFLSLRKRLYIAYRFSKRHFSQSNSVWRSNRLVENYWRLAPKPFKSRVLMSANALSLFFERQTSNFPQRLHTIKRVGSIRPVYDAGRISSEMTIVLVTVHVTTLLHYTIND